MKHMFGHPPWEFLTMEITYLVLVVVLCLFIYFRTKEIYDLSKHKGIAFFRNTFLYFALAYLFRFIAVSGIFWKHLFDFAMPRHLNPISLFLMNYFGIMAILSLAFSTLKKKVDDNYLHTIAIVIACISFFGRIQIILIIIGLLLFTFTIIKGYNNYRSQKKSSTLLITYLLLFVFWVVNQAPLVNYFFQREIKIFLYLVSVGIFIFILYRVNKRLTNGKKTG